jgi:Tol biopolymer transport system component
VCAGMSLRQRLLRAHAALAAAVITLGLLLALVAPSLAADPAAPHHSPAHWLPNEEWVWQHWLPYDEQRLYALLGISRSDLWHLLRDDTHTVGQLGEKRGWNSRRLANALVAPRRQSVPAAKYRELRSRALRTLTQGHLAQHIFFHSLHTAVIPNRASRIFGVSNTDELQRLRRAELSPLQIARLYGRSRAEVTSAAKAALEERVRAGVRGGDMPASQGAILLGRQLRQLPRWLGQVRYNGPPPLRRNPNAILDAKDYANNAVVSGDGHQVVFESYESSIPLANKNGEINVRMRGVGAPHSRLVSLVEERDRDAPRSAYNPSVSADGRYVAYESSPGNLNFAKRYGGIGVVARDMITGRIIHVDPRSTSDARKVRRSSYNPSVSADGHYVAFESSRQVRRGRSYSYEVGVFVHDLRTGKTAPLRVAGPNAGRDASEPQISGDGRYVAFTSTIRSGGGPSRVYVQDVETGKMTLISRADGPGGKAARGESYEPQITSDGRYVAFTSTAPELGGGAGPGRARIFVRDLRQGKTELASVPGGESLPAKAFAFEPAISGNGRFVAFASVVPGRSGISGRASQVYVRDMQSGTTALVSRESGGDGASSKGFSSAPSISADGRFVAFTSDAPNLSDRKFDLTRGTFVRDTATGKTALVSKGFAVKGSNTRKVLAVIAASVLVAGLAVLLGSALLRRRRQPAHAATG